MVLSRVWERNWFRHDDETDSCLHVAEQQRRDGRELFCPSSLGNGDMCWTSLSILGGCSRSRPSRPPMGTVGRPWVSNRCDGKNLGGLCSGDVIYRLGHETSLQSTGDKNNASRRETCRDTIGFAHMGRIDYTIIYGKQASRFERWRETVGIAVNVSGWGTWLIDNRDVTAVTYSRKHAMAGAYTNEERSWRNV